MFHSSTVEGMLKTSKLETWGKENSKRFSTDFSDISNKATELQSTENDI